MMPSSLLLITLTCLIFNLGKSAQVTEEDYPVEVDVIEVVEINECKRSSDCLPFYFCAQEGLMGKICLTYNVEASNPIQCNGTDKSGNFYPIHEICRQAAMNLTASAVVGDTARCYQSLNYTCSMSYFMPCTPNYDSQGAVIVGQEESCPDPLSCVPYKYGQTGNTTTEVKLCKLSKD